MSMFNFMMGLAILYCMATDSAYRAVKGNAMRLFNSFQIIGFYAGTPWLLGYLFRQDFPFHGAACVAAVVLYGIFSLMMVGCVYTATEKWDK